MPYTTFANHTSANPKRLFWDILKDPNLVGFWLLNETSGTTVYDRCTRNRITGTMVNTPTLGATLGNGFNGMTFAAASSEYVNLGSPTALKFGATDPCSAVALCSVNDTAVQKRIISMDSTTGANGWAWSINPDETLVIERASSASAFYTTTSNAAVATGTLIMPGFSDAGTGVPTGVVLYNNGASVADTDNDQSLGAINYTGVSAGIGAGRSNTVRFFDGTLAFVAVFNAAKSASDFSRWAKLAGVL